MSTDPGIQFLNFEHALLYPHLAPVPATEPRTRIRDKAAGARQLLREAPELSVNLLKKVETELSEYPQLLGELKAELHI